MYNALHIGQTSEDNLNLIIIRQSLKKVVMDLADRTMLEDFAITNVD